jgi:hypothetical protein
LFIIIKVLGCGFRSDRALTIEFAGELVDLWKKSSFLLLVFLLALDEFLRLLLVLLAELLKTFNHHLMLRTHHRILVCQFIYLFLKLSNAFLPYYICPLSLFQHFNVQLTQFTFQLTDRCL